MERSLQVSGDGALQRWPHLPVHATNSAPHPRMPVTSQDSRPTARWMIVCAAVLFSTGGAAIKGCQLDAFEIACLRSLVAAVAVYLVLPEARRFLHPLPMLVGIFYAATLVLFVTANKLTTAANAIYLQSTAPIYVVLLGPLLLKERIRRLDLISLPFFAAAMVLCFLGERSPTVTAPDPDLGDSLALLSGIGWAITVVGLRHLARREPAATPVAAVVAGNLLAFGICAPFAFPLSSTATSDLLAVGYLGIFQIGLAYILLVRGLPRLPVVESALLLLVEPVLNPVFAFLLHDEVPATGSILGGLLILATLAGRSLAERGRPTTA